MSWILKKKILINFLVFWFSEIENGEFLTRNGRQINNSMVGIVEIRKKISVANYWLFGFRKFPEINIPEYWFFWFFFSEKFPENRFLTIIDFFQKFPEKSTFPIVASFHFFKNFQNLILPNNDFLYISKNFIFLTNAFFDFLFNFKKINIPNYWFSNFFSQKFPKNRHSRTSIFLKVSKNQYFQLLFFFSFLKNSQKIKIPNKPIFHNNWFFWFFLKIPKNQYYQLLIFFKNKFLQKFNIPVTQSSNIKHKIVKPKRSEFSWKRHWIEHQIWVWP